MMLVFVLAGGWALTELNTSFFPEFETNKIGVAASYRGLDAQEVEATMLQPLENRLRSVDGLEDMTAYAREGSASIWLEFPEGVDMEQALSDVKAAVEEVELPAAADAPRSFIQAREDEVAKMTVATARRSELRDLARRIEADFNAQGIGKLKVEGLPEEELVALVDQRLLVELGLTLAEVGAALRAQNADLSVGGMRGLGNERSLRTEPKTADITKLYGLPVGGDAQSGVIYLQDIARIERRSAPDQVEVVHNGLPAVRFEVIKTSGGDLIDAADRLYAWLERLRPTLPPSVVIELHDESWRAVDARMELLLKNGLSGLLVVVALLYLFLSRQVALWVAVGIPVAMLGTLFVFQQLGGTFNMISMFALIMAVGIIVDDSIVVGENAQHRLSQGAPPMRAVTGAAKTMFTPVFASSFTTIASFMPLFLVGGTIGKIIFDIPLIIICILIAALIECFLVLPGHLYSSFAARLPAKPRGLRAVIDRGFDAFRERVFRPVAGFAVRNATATIAACLTVLALSGMMLVHGFVSYRFFPGAEGNELRASFEFSAGTPRARMEAYVNEAVGKLEAVAAREAPDAELVKHVSALYGFGGGVGNADSRARVEVELVDLDQREIGTQRFSQLWRRALGPLPPGVEKLSMRGGKRGGGGQDLEIQIAGADSATLKEVSAILQDALAAVPELSAVEDDTPYGEDQLLFSLTPLGQSLNLNVALLARQISDAIDGFRVQTFTAGVDETDLKVRYAEDAGLDTLYIRAPKRAVRTAGGPGRVAAGERVRGDHPPRRQSGDHGDRRPGRGGRRRRRGRHRRARDADAAGAARRLRGVLFLRGPAVGAPARGRRHAAGPADHAAAGLRDPGGGLQLLEPAPGGDAVDAAGRGRLDPGALGAGADDVGAVVLRHLHADGDHGQQRHRAGALLPGHRAGRRRRRGLRAGDRRRGLPAAAGGAADLADDDRRPDAADVRDLAAGAVFDPDGGEHRLRPGVLGGGDPAVHAGVHGGPRRRGPPAAAHRPQARRPAAGGGPAQELGACWASAG